MKFQLSEEHEMIRKMVRDFAENEVAPTAAERDEEERFDREIFDKMAELGLTGIPWPEEYGGIGSDYLAYCDCRRRIVPCVRIDGGDCCLPTLPWPAGRFTNSERKNKSKNICARSPRSENRRLRLDGAGQRVRCGRHENNGPIRRGHYVLNGSKIFITNGGVAEIYIVFAVTDPEKKQRGITCFYRRKRLPGLFSRQKGKQTRHPFLTDGGNHF